MKTWRLHDSQRGEIAPIDGETIAVAVLANLATIAQRAGLGNAAGYQIHRATITPPDPSVTRDGKTFATLTIWYSGLDLAHRPATSEPTAHEVYIFAQPEDLPEPITLG